MADKPPEKGEEIGNHKMRVSAKTSGQVSAMNSSLGKLMFLWLYSCRRMSFFWDVGNFTGWAD